jgi:Peptidase propeptide and YPEB domain
VTTAVAQQPHCPPGGVDAGPVASRYTAAMRLRPLALVLAGLVLAAAASPAAALGGAGNNAQMLAGARRLDGRPLSLEEAVELVKRRYDARVVRAEEATEGEEAVYRIRLLATDGRVFTVLVNARTGQLE